MIRLSSVRGFFRNVIREILLNWLQMPGAMGTGSRRALWIRTKKDELFFEGVEAFFGLPKLEDGLEPGPLSLIGLAVD
jgi:hypothetical protein